MTVSEYMRWLSQWLLFEAAPQILLMLGSAAAFGLMVGVVLVLVQVLVRRWLP